MNGLDDDPLNVMCDACGAQPAEPCRPGCGSAARATNEESDTVVAAGPDSLALPCIVFRISKLWYSGMPADELYEAARGWWKLGSRREIAPYAVAVAEGVIRQVYEIYGWIPRYRLDGSIDRWGFEGEQSEEHQHLIGLDVHHLFRKGAANPVSYVNLDFARAAEPEPTAPPAVTSRARSQSMARTVSELADNPVLVLSLNSKEVFHSNLLGWLIKRSAAFGRVVLGPWLQPDQHCTTSRVLWEKNHLDLVVELPGYRPLVIENKVFSLPDESQLLGYATKNIPQAGITDPSRVLLSVLDPGWSDRTWGGWTWAPWGELIDRVEQASPFFKDDAFVSTLMAHWVALVRGLTELTSLVTPSETQEPLQLDGNALNELQDIRLDAAMQKFRTFAVRLLLRERLSHTAIDVDLIKSDYGSSGPLLEVLVNLPDMSKVGWQLQGGLWRRFVICPPALAGPAMKADRIEYVERNHSSWLTFEIEQTHGPFATAPSAKYKHFNPLFVCDYIRVPSISVQQILDMGEDVSRAAVEYATTFLPSAPDEVLSGAPDTPVP